MRVVDLFAGCGGLSLGFEQQGFNIVAAFELWDAAIKCYEANFTHPIFKIDLSDTQAAVQLIKEYQPDIIIGGPPCQDFSHAGKRVELTLLILSSRLICLIPKLLYNLLKSISQISLLVGHLAKTFLMQAKELRIKEHY